MTRQGEELENSEQEDIHMCHPHEQVAFRVEKVGLLTVTDSRGWASWGDRVHLNLLLRMELTMWRDSSVNHALSLPRTNGP